MNTMFRCGQCDAVCGTKYMCTFHASEDEYMGRVDDSKKITHYYCSASCRSYVYVTEIREMCADSIPHVQRSLDFLKQHYRMDLQTADTKKLTDYLIHMKVYSSVNTLYQSVLDKKTLLELQTLKQKALKSIGDAMEQQHENANTMDKYIQLHGKIDDFKLELLCK